MSFLGLPWNDKCVDFHKSDRPVKTASVAQVRKPIYKTSVKRWKKYGAGSSRWLTRSRSDPEPAEAEEVQGEGQGIRLNAFPSGAAAARHRQPSGIEAENLKAMRALTHLDRLEAESIQILRETVAEADRPVMLYSIGKDSAVMLHLAKKAFFPSPCRFPCFTSTRRGSSGRCTSFVTRSRRSQASSDRPHQSRGRAAMESIRS